MSDTHDSHLFTNNPESETAYIADPLADLLLSIGAVVILIVIAIFPTIPQHSTSHARSAGTLRVSPKQFIFRFAGREVDPLIAAERGLVIGGPSPPVVPVDRIFLDESLVATLEQMRNAGEPVILLIEPDGLETAFQLEIVAGRHGPRRMRVTRLVSNCNPTKSDVFALNCVDLVNRSGAPP